MNCPTPQSTIIDLYFMEHRAKLIDIAAFLDRLDRAKEMDANDDYRLRAMQRAIDLLQDGKPNRAARILDLFSDPTTDPIPQAPGKGATGVWPKFREHE